MIEEIKIMLGDSVVNYTDAQIGLFAKQALIEVEAYCGREADAALELAAEQIAVIKLNRMGSEGLAAQSYSGVNENYIDGYPAHIQSLLDRKRRVKVIG